MPQVPWWSDRAGPSSCRVLVWLCNVPNAQWTHHSQGWLLTCYLLWVFQTLDCNCNWRPPGSDLFLYHCQQVPLNNTVFLFSDIMQSFTVRTTKSIIHKKKNWSTEHSKFKFCSAKGMLREWKDNWRKNLQINIQQGNFIAEFINKNFKRSCA